MVLPGCNAYGDDEFGLLRALSASQRHSAELLARAEVTAKEIEAQADATVEAILMGPSPGELAIDEIAAQVDAALRREREVLEASLQLLHEQLAAASRRLPLAETLDGPASTVRP